MRISLVAYAVMVALQSEQYNRRVVKKTTSVGSSIVFEQLKQEQTDANATDN